MEEARGAGRASLVECLLTGVIRNPQSRDRLQVAPPGAPGQRWEFIKENKKVRKQENTLSTKKAIKKKKILAFLIVFFRFLGRERVFFFLFFS